MKSSLSPFAQGNAQMFRSGSDRIAANDTSYMAKVDRNKEAYIFGQIGLPKWVLLGLGAIPGCINQAILVNARDEAENLDVYRATMVTLRERCDAGDWVKVICMQSMSHTLHYLLALGLLHDIYTMYTNWETNGNITSEKSEPCNL